MMNKWFEIKAKNDEKRASVYLFGDIVSEKWDETEVTAKSFIDELNALDVADIDLFINSPGGAVFEASAIYNAIKRHPAEVAVHIEGVAASAASLVAMAGDVIEMGDNALFMIHNPWSMVMIAGDSKLIREASERTAKMMDSAKDAMINAYAQRSSLSRDEISAAMDAETWYTASEALDAGFIDAIFTGHKLAASADLSRYSNPPKIVSGKAPANTDPNDRGNDYQQSGGNPMTTATQAPAASPPAEDENRVKQIEAAARAKAMKEDKERRAGILSLFMKFSDKMELCRELQDDDECTIDMARARLLDDLGSGAQPLGTTTRIETGEDEWHKFRRGVVDGLSARMRLQSGDPQNELRALSIRKIAERCLMKATGQGQKQIDQMRALDLFGAAITHTTSDFPVLLEDTMHKEIVGAYSRFADTWSRWCKVGQVSDFRAHKRLTMLGSFNNIAVVNEAGEYQSSTLSDATKEPITADTKGRTLGISRQTLINDDLGALADAASGMGRAAARTVETDVYTALLSNSGVGPTLTADSTALFHANHGNLMSGGAVTAANVATGRDLMRAQQDTDSNEFLDITPVYFLSGLSQEDTARVLFVSETNPVSSNSRVPNPVRNLISSDNIITTPRITGNVWYLAASPQEAPVFEVAFLDGVREPFIEQTIRTNPDGLTVLVRLDYGIAALNFRGMVRNPQS